MEKSIEIKKGLVKVNSEGESFEVIKVHKDGTFLIHFPKPSFWQVVSFEDLRYGKVRNKAERFLFGVGYISTDEKNPFDLKFGLTEEIYKRWISMMTRCYNESGLHPSYKNVTVAEEWHDFSNFNKWCLKQGVRAYIKDLALDKDLLSGGQKIYSPETCTFLPISINSLLVQKDDFEKFIINDKTFRLAHRIDEEMKINSRLLPFVAKKKLNSLLKDYMKAYKERTGLTFERFRPSNNPSPRKSYKLDVNLSKEKIICMMKYRNELVMYRNLQELQHFITTVTERLQEESERKRKYEKQKTREERKKLKEQNKENNSDNNNKTINNK